MSRDSAYVLRRRDALFARGWNAARLLAREASVDLLADMAMDGTEEEVWQRGEMVGTRCRFDTRLLLAHIARLDKMADEAEGAASDSARFDAVLAAIAGAEMPEELRDEFDPVAIPRECAVEDAAQTAAERVERAWAERVPAPDEDSEDDEESASLSAEDYAEYAHEHAAAIAAARSEAVARWDTWFGGACSAVDALLARQAAGTPSPVAAPGTSPSSATASPEPLSPAKASHRTMSDVSVSPQHATFVGPNGNRYARA